MIPAAFDYHRPGSIEEAVALLELHGDDAKVLAGGHSLIPAMKLRLAQPKMLIDIGRIADLKYIREEKGTLAIGAMTTHYEIQSSELVRQKCPLLAAVAAEIGDVQVRNLGSIGGSLVHADPAADWPAAILALDAELVAFGSMGRREIAAQEFFVNMMQSAVRSNELLCEIRVATTAASVAYVKFAQKASGFALAGAGVVLNRAQKSVRIGITGIAPIPYRANSVEAELAGKEWTAELIAAAADKAADGIEPLSDIHASAEYRAHLARVSTKRALETALA